MQRIKLSSRESVANADKAILTRYMESQISKQTAMRLISENNGSETMISEEYFDYLFESLGYAEADEEADAEFY